MLGPLTGRKARARLGMRWMIGTLFVAAIVVGCIAAGFWQLRRLDERRAVSAQVLARSAELVDLPDEGFVEDADAAALMYRKVRVTGTYDREHELLARFRTRKGLPGYEVVTPLVVSDGIVLVDRGWVPLDVGDRWPVPNPDLPTRPVEVEGILVRAESGRVGITPSDGTKPAVVSSIAPRKLGSAVGADGRAVYALTVLASDSSESFPAPIGPPSLGDGPHRDYAVQWFLFATVGIVGWPILLLRRGPLARSAHAASLDHERPREA